MRATSQTKRAVPGRSWGALGVLYLLLVAMPGTAVAEEQPANPEAVAGLAVQPAVLLDASRPHSTAPKLAALLLQFRQAKLATVERRSRYDVFSNGIVQLSSTPFAREMSLPLGAVWQGRLAFRGFSSSSSMENLLWGLPGGGSLPAWSATGHSHISAQTPKQATTYGLALTLHRGTAGTLVRSSFKGGWVSRIFRLNHS